MNGEEVTFNVQNALKHPKESKLCFSVDVLDKCVFERSCCTETLKNSVYDPEALNMDESEDLLKDQSNQDSSEIETLQGSYVTKLAPSIE